MSEISSISEIFKWALDHPVLSIGGLVLVNISAGLGRMVYMHKRGNAIEQYAIHSGYQFIRSLLLPTDIVEREFPLFQQERGKPGQSNVVRGALDSAEFEWF
jgi:hypothetical protein